MKSKTLTKRQEQVLPIILSSTSYEEAARKAKISPKQIYEWLKDDCFREELAQQRNAMFSEAMETLKITSQKAVQTFLNLLDHDNAKIKLSAADKILSFTFKGKEILEIEKRITSLEELANAKS